MEYQTLELWDSC